jgi:hypothetical protein
MTGLDVPWAITELEKFVHATDQVPSSYPNVIGLFQRENDDVVAELAHVAERILDRTLSAWRSADHESARPSSGHRWDHLREWASRGIAALKRQEELRERLGDAAPSISAGNLHPWVWSGARPRWQSGHFRSAVEDAAKKVNAETQTRSVAEM